MTPDEIVLSQIRAKCAQLIRDHDPKHAGYLTAKQAVSGWRATITAIDALDLIHAAAVDGDDMAWTARMQIIEDWPIECL